MPGAPNTPPGISNPIAGQPGPGGVFVFYWSPTLGWVAAPASGDWSNLLPDGQLPPGWPTSPPTTPPEGGEPPVPDQELPPDAAVPEAEKQQRRR